MRELRRVSLPTHVREGGFDHAAVDGARQVVYVAHTSNDAVEVVDLSAPRWARSLPGLRGVAGVWVSSERDLLFTSNRGENTASVFHLPDEREVFRMGTGDRPNGLAFDPKHQTLLVAGVGNIGCGGPPTATFYDVAHGTTLYRIELPGRTRWATYHPRSNAFYVNIADPPRIAVLDGEAPFSLRRLIDIPAVGPHGLEQDPGGVALYCACDDGRMVRVDLETGAADPMGILAGAPDVLWLNPRLGRLYVAIGDPGVVQVLSTPSLEVLETYRTEAGAHTLTVDVARNQVHIFLPETHADLVLQDG